MWWGNKKLIKELREDIERLNKNEMLSRQQLSDLRISNDKKDKIIQELKEEIKWEKIDIQDVKKEVLKFTFAKTLYMTNKHMSACLEKDGAWFVEAIKETGIDKLIRLHLN